MLNVFLKILSLTTLTSLAGLLGRCLFLAENKNKTTQIIKAEDSKDEELTDKKEKHEEFVNQLKNIITRNRLTGTTPPEEIEFVNTLDAVAIILTYPPILDGLELTQEKIAPTKPRNDQDPVTFIRHLFTWVKENNVRDSIITAYAQLKDSLTPDSSDRIHMLQIFIPAFLSQVENISDILAVPKTLNEILHTLPQRIKDCDKQDQHSLEKTLIQIEKEVLLKALEAFKEIYPDPSQIIAAKAIKDASANVDDRGKRNAMIIQLIALQFSYLITEFSTEKSLNAQLYSSILQAANQFLMSIDMETWDQNDNVYEILEKNITQVCDPESKDRPSRRFKFGLDNEDFQEGLVSKALTATSDNLLDVTREGSLKTLNDLLALRGSIPETLLVSTLGNTWVTLARSTIINKEPVGPFFQLEHAKKIAETDSTLFKNVFNYVCQNHKSQAATTQILNVLKLSDSALSSLHQAALHNDNAQLSKLAKEMTPISQQENRASHALRYEHTLSNALKNGATPLPFYFDDARIEQYFLDQITEFEKSGKLGGADAMRSILNSALPLHTKLHMLAAIGKGKSNNAFLSLSRMGRRKEVREFYKNLRVFEDLASPDEVHKTFENFLRNSKKVSSKIENIEHHIQRYTLLRLGLQGIQLTPKDKASLARFLNRYCTKSLSDRPLKVLNEIEWTQKFLNLEKPAIQNAIASPKNTGNYTQPFSQWIQFAIATQTSPTLEDLLLIGVRPTTGQLVECCKLVHNAQKKLGDEAASIFIRALAKTTLSAEKETKTQLVQALSQALRNHQPGAQAVLNEMFYQAALHNDSKILVDLACIMPQSSQTTRQRYDFWTFSDGTIQRYLLGQIKSLRRIIPGTAKHFGGISVPTALGYKPEISSAPAMKEIINSDLQLSQKLQILAAIADAKGKNRIISTQAPETWEFYQYLKNFSDITEEEIFESQFIKNEPLFFLYLNEESDENINNQVNVKTFFNDLKRYLKESKNTQEKLTVFARALNYVVNHIKNNEKSRESFVQDVFIIFRNLSLFFDENTAVAAKIILTSFTSLLKNHYEETIHYIAEGNLKNALLASYETNLGNVNLNSSDAIPTEKDDMEHTSKANKKSCNVNFSEEELASKTSKKYFERKTTTPLRRESILKYLQTKVSSLPKNDATNAILAVLNQNQSFLSKIWLISVIAKQALARENSNPISEEEKEFYLKIQNLFLEKYSIKMENLFPFTEEYENQAVVQRFIFNYFPDENFHRYYIDLVGFETYFSLLQQNIRLIAPETIDDKNIQSQLKAWQNPGIFSDYTTRFQNCIKFNSFLEKNSTELRKAIYASQKNLQQTNTSFIQLFMNWVRFSEKYNQTLNEKVIALIGIVPSLTNVVECQEEIQSPNYPISAERREDLVNLLNQCYINKINYDGSNTTVENQILQAIDFFSATEFSSISAWKPTLPVLTTLQDVRNFFEKQVFTPYIQESLDKLTDSQKSKFIMNLMICCTETLASNFDKAILEAMIWNESPIEGRNLRENNGLISTLQGICDSVFGNETCEQIEFDKIEMKKGSHQGVVLAQLCDQLEKKGIELPENLEKVGKKIIEKLGLLVKNPNEWHVGLYVAYILGNSRLGERYLTDKHSTQEEKKFIYECWLQLYPKEAIVFSILNKIQYFKELDKAYLACFSPQLFANALEQVKKTKKDEFESIKTMAIQTYLEKLTHPDDQASLFEYLKENKIDCDASINQKNMKNINSLFPVRIITHRECPILSNMNSKHVP